MTTVVQLKVAAANGRPQRLVIATAGEIEHRDHFCTSSAISRKRFITAFADKIGRTVEELPGLDDRLVQSADEADAIAEAAPASGAPESDDGPRKSQATRLVDLVHETGAELWHDPAGDGYITIPRDEHKENYKLRSQSTKRWLARLFYQATGTAAGGQAITDARAVLEGKASHDGPEHLAHLRLAEFNSDVYLDLGGPDWRAVEIRAGGWRVVTNPPVWFRRAKAMLPLPDPVKGGRLDELREFVSVGDDDWILVLSWLLAAARPRGPYPVLCLSAQQGSGKSTTGSMLRKLIDPNDAELRDSPRNPHELMIAANNGWIVGYDNLSGIPPWLSDCLCRLATGAGFSTRQLYSDDEEIIFRATRPAVVTGIEDLAVRGDLLDRALLVNLQQIPPARRLPETDLWRRFNAARPRIFGALLDAVSMALRNLPSTRLDELPRMADFCIWSTAAEPAMGLPRGGFLRIYLRNRDSAHVVALEASPVSAAVRQLVADGNPWSGTATDLLAALDEITDERTVRQRGWPKQPNHLTGKLKRIAPNLQAVGIELAFGERTPDRKRSKVLRITPLGNTCNSSSASSGNAPMAGKADDPDGPDDEIAPSAYPDDDGVFV